MAESQPLTVRLTDIGPGGAALGWKDGRVVLAPYGIPGETVCLEVTRSKGARIEGTVTQVLQPSPHRISPPCPYFGACGGCQWQHIDYEHQLELKRRILKQQLERIGKIQSPYVPPTLPSPQQWNYRNHARFSMGRNNELGFIETDGRRFLQVDSCGLMHPQINRTLGKLQGKGSRAHQVSVRYGTGTGETMIQPAQSAIDCEPPQSYFSETLFGYRFRISGPSFFQVNTPQAEQLIAAVRDRLDLKGNEVLVDAYAGVGTFAVLLASYVKQVIAIEESSAAVSDARVNCAPFKNIEIVIGKTEAVLPRLEEHPDAVILDPPRVGCQGDVLDALVFLAPRRIVYVSCDPATLARDMGILCQRGYRLLESLPVDMFPQTNHIESVNTLVRRDSFEN